MKGWKIIFQKAKQSECSHTYIRQNILQAKKLIRDTCGQYIMIKRTIHQEDINIYEPNIGTLKYIKQVLRDPKGELTATQ